MDRLDFPLTLHTRTNLTGATVPTEVASRQELEAELRRAADATEESARNFADQILGGSQVNVTARGREITLYATQD